MASPNQSQYIADLAVAKTKEFKEVKELLTASGIVGENAEIVKDAESIKQITDALDDLQASKFIDVLIDTKEPARGTQYSQRRIEKASDLVDDIKSTIAGWDFK